MADVIVGIGYAAGGRLPLREILPRLPAGHDLAVVLVPHPDPADTAQAIAADLAAISPMPVVIAEDGIPMRPDCVYVVPATHLLSLADGKFVLKELAQCEGMRMPVDHFLCSLAEQHGSGCCGVLLSGEGPDGTLGLSEIKAAGGRTLVLDPAEAAAPEMPQGAVSAGVVDAVLPASEIAKALLAYADRVRDREPAEDDQSALRSILALLRSRTGHDFLGYKPNTLLRRARRRMGLVKADTLWGYFRFLQLHAEEVHQLRRDLLIGVTDFFRQVEAWRYLEERVLGPLIAGAGPKKALRAWVPACATGKEAYTLAMLLCEAAEATGEKIPIQIFATDADEAAIETARAGLYPEAELRSVPAERLKRFFVRRGASYQASKKIRETIVFAQQNLTSDPPFAKLDLVSCRNLLIYLDAQAQKQALEIFHFALRDGGCLFLGAAESVGGNSDLFAAISKKWRIFRRLPVSPAARPVLPPFPTTESAGTRAAIGGAGRRGSLALLAQQMLLERFAPAAAITDRRRRLLFNLGPVDRYLTVAPGEGSLDVVEMAREGLRTVLRGAFGKAVAEDRAVNVAGRVQRDGSTIPVRMTVTPLRAEKGAEALLLVTFEDGQPATPAAAEASDCDVGTRQLETELGLVREELQSAVDQLEASNEELKASNEEAMASNEELQSANEELETSQEELQSLNDELNTLNARLLEKNDELESANNDLVNFLSGTGVATVFLDRELKVRRFTPQVTALLSLIAADAGRPLADIVRKVGDDALIPDAALVLQDLLPRAAEVCSADGRWHVRRIMPYRTLDGRIEGAVITYTEVTELKTAEAEAARLASFPERNPNPVVEVDLNGRVSYQNPAARALMPDLTERGLAHRWLTGLPEVAEHLARTGAKQILREVTIGTATHEQALSHDAQTGGMRIYGRDVTERKRAEEALKASYAELETRVLERTRELWQASKTIEAERQRFYDVLEMLPAYVVLLTPDYRVPFANRFFRDRFGDSFGRRCYEYLFERVEPCEVCETFTVLKTHTTHHWEWTGPDGRNYDIHDYPFTDTDGSPMIMEVGVDITERKRAEDALRKANETLELRVAERTAALRASEESYRRIVDTANEGVWLVDPERRTTYVNEKMAEMLGYAADEMVGKSALAFVDQAGRALSDANLERGRQGVAESYELRLIRRDGSPLWTLVNASPLFEKDGGFSGTMNMLTDITERKRGEEEQEATVQFLRLVNESHNATELIRGATAFFQERSGCEAVGIRLRDQVDFPYFEARGFAKDFLDEENRLCVRDEEGKPVLDGAGNPRLACLCGTVICGSFDPKQPFFTNRGNFWTNSTSRLRAETNGADLPTGTRHRCNEEGYESVALIALTLGEERLGLLQLNDRRAGRFSAEALALWERLADYLAVAVAKFRADAEMKRRGAVLNGINAIFRAALTCGTAEELGRACLAVAEEVTGSAFGFIGEIGADGLLHATAISDPGWDSCTMHDRAGHRRALGGFTIHGMYGRVLLDGTSFFTNDPASHPDSVGTPAGHPRLQSFLGVPLRRDGEIIGMIAMGNRAGGFGQEELESLEGLAAAVVEALHRVRTERALSRSEERLERAQAIAHLGSWELDLVDNALTWSDEVYRIFGLEPREFGATYEAFLEAVHPDDRAAVDAAYLDSLRQGRDSYEIEHRIVRAGTGEIRVVHERCAHFRDGAGTIIRSIGMVHDITERKRAEQALQDSLQRFALLAHAGGELLQAAELQKVVESICRRVMEYLGCQVFLNFLVDEKTNRLHLNACAGLSPEEAHTIEWLEYGHAVCGCVARDGCRIIAEHIPDTYDVRTEQVKSFGIKAYCCNPLLGPGGKVIGTLSFGTRSRETFRDDDISLMQAVTDLVAVALSRMQTTVTLRRTAEELARSNQDLAQFAYVASHDLQEPLRMVSGFVSLLQVRYDDRFDDQARDFVGRALEGTARMRQLIDDLLEYGRVDRGERHVAPLPAREALDVALANLANVIAERGAEVTADELPTVVGDRARLAAVLQNLVANAITYRRPETAPRVHVGAQRRGDSWVFSVRDNGIGIPSAQFDRIFLIFQRLHNRETYPGTGVGLAIVKKIVEAAGGRVWVESRLGEGSTFFFSLPAGGEARHGRKRQDPGAARE